jgi:hypothetical protein
MAVTDSSIYQLRYNQITQILEGGSAAGWAALTLDNPGAPTLSLTDAHIYVGNASNIATDVAMSGDVTIARTGATAIGALKITNAMVNASAAIALSKLAAVTASKVLVSDGSGFVSASSVTATTLGYLDATSSIQTQLNAKASLSGATFTGALTLQKANIQPVVAYTASTATPYTPDARLADLVVVTVDANLTINGPSNPYNGQRIAFRLDNDGSHTVTFATGSGNFNTGTVGSYAATASKSDYVVAYYNSAETRWNMVALSPAF